MSRVIHLSVEDCICLRQVYPCKVNTLGYVIPVCTPNKIFSQTR